MDPNLFGVPGKGIHSYRFCGVAIVDVMMTVIIAWFTSFYFSIPLWKSFIAWFVAGEIIHLIVKVPTAIVRLITYTPNRIL